MRLSAWLPLAALSALSVCPAAVRPRYGGTLRAEMRSAPTTLGPAAQDAAALRSLVFETLVRLDGEGTPQPCLALTWQHDPAARHWQFTLRPGVKLQDGSPLTPAGVVSALQEALPGVTAAVTADGVSIRASHPMPDLLLDLARDGWLATGPFRPSAFEPGRRATFAANLDYWGGRPFLDAIEIQFGRTLRDQLADFELGKADLVETGPADSRRAAVQTQWSSANTILVALAFVPATRRPEIDGRLREALALSIDRAAMHTVLLQKQGEISSALLPQWISGYAFAFPAASDLARARTLAAALPPAARTLTLSYDPALGAARPLAERIAVNARDAGLTVRVTADSPQADVRLVEVRLASLDPSQALAGLAGALSLPAPAHAESAAALYESERRLLDTFRAIPLFHLPVTYAVSNHVRVVGAPPLTRLGDWQFGGVYLTGTAP